MAEFARNYPVDPVDVIISDYMSEYNMAVAAARRVSHTDSSTEAGLINRSGGPAYEATFLESLEPALEDIARYKIRIVANSGVADTKALYDVVTAMVAKRGLDLKVCLFYIFFHPIWLFEECTSDGGISLGCLDIRR